MSHFSLLAVSPWKYNKSATGDRPHRINVCCGKGKFGNLRWEILLQDETFRWMAACKLAAKGKTMADSVIHQLENLDPLRMQEWFSGSIVGCVLLLCMLSDSKAAVSSCWFQRSGSNRDLNIEPEFLSLRRHLKKPGIHAAGYLSDTVPVAQLVTAPTAEGSR